MLLKGIDRKQIKIRGINIFLNNKLYGKITPSQFCLSENTSASDNSNPMAASATIPPTPSQWLGDNIPPNKTISIGNAPVTPLLTVLTLNCQPILAKQGSFMNLIDTRNPDIIIRSESWLKSDILSCEVFPPGYTVYRHDRANGYGGVFVACCESLISFSLETGDTSSELVACQISLSNNPTLIVCSIYWPPSR